MSTITIRNLPPDVIERLKARANRHGKSMEQEVSEMIYERLEDGENAIDAVEAEHRKLKAFEMMEALHRKISNPPNAEEIGQWVANARKGRDWMKDSPWGSDE